MELLSATSISGLLGMYILWHAAPLYRGIQEIIGAHLTGAWVAEVAVAASVLLLPTALVGATFGHLAQAATRNGFGLGRALAVNTLGGASPRPCLASCCCPHSVRWPP